MDPLETVHHKVDQALFSLAAGSGTFEERLRWAHAVAIKFLRGDLPDPQLAHQLNWVLLKCHTCSQTEFSEPLSDEERRGIVERLLNIYSRTAPGGG